MKIDKYANIFYILTLIVIIFFPKINIVNVPGTYIGIRIEDFLVLSFTIYYMVKTKCRLTQLQNEEMKKVILLFFVYICVCLLSTISGVINENIELAFGFLYLLRKIEYFIFIFIGFEFFKSEDNQKILFKILDISIITHFVIALLQNYGMIGGVINGEYVSTASSRTFSTFNGPYEFSTYMTLLLPFYIVKALRCVKDRNELVKSLIRIVCITFGVFMSQSRTAIILLIALLIITPIIELRKSIFNFIKLNKFKSFMIVVLLITLITMILAFLPKIDRFKSLEITSMLNTLEVSWENKDFERYKEGGFYVISTSNVDDSFAIRINKWMALIDGTLQHPIFGLGLSVTREACDGNYIRILAESGVMGVICWIALIVVIFKSTLKSQNDINIIAKYGLVVLLLTAVFIDVFEASKIMMFYWFIFGCLYASYNKKST